MRLELPEPLLAWLDAALPEANARRVKLLFAPRLPFDWLPSDRQRFTAMTLWRTVHVRDRGRPFDLTDAPNVELVLHELAHVAQYARLGDVVFPMVYLARMVHGYDAHPLEREAREVAATLMARLRAERPELLR